MKSKLMMLEELLETKQKELLESENSLINLKLNYQMQQAASSFGGGEVELVQMQNFVSTLQAEVEAYTKMKNQLISDSQKEILITGGAEEIRDFLLDHDLPNDYFVLSKVEQDAGK